MEIEYYGANCFKIFGKKASIVIDDNLSELGAKSVTKDNDVSLRTFAAYDSVTGRMTIEQPGEYEISNISVVGIAARAHTGEQDTKTSTIYKIVIDDIKIAVMGHIYPELSDDQLESIGAVDILLIPVGNSGYTMDAIGALKVIRKIEPKIVVPSHYADKALKYEVPQQELETAIKDLAMEPKERLAKLKLKSTDIAVDDT
ncbi:MAG: MBL fold metallo-hydrolase, partial [Minisyncoccia bacterium]